MKDARTYSRLELEGITFVLAEMLKNSDVFLQQADETKRAHPWLTEVVETLSHQIHYIDMIERGGGKTTFDSDGGIVRIMLPTECFTDGENAFWGDTLPIEFHFTKTESGGYTFERSFSNESRAEFRNQ